LQYSPKIYPNKNLWFENVPSGNPNIQFTPVTPLSRAVLGHLVYFVVVWYNFSRVGMLYQEKCGNPALEVVAWVSGKY
jgi:hypothetical protein